MESLPAEVWVKVAKCSIAAVSFNENSMEMDPRFVAYKSIRRLCRGTRRLVDEALVHRMVLQPTLHSCAAIGDAEWAEEMLEDAGVKRRVNAVDEAGT